MDQEKRIAYLKQNDWSTAPVPMEYRRSNYGVVATLVGQIIALSGIYIGAGMVGGLTLTQAFIATVIGSAILAVLGGFLSWVGTKTGVGLSMLLRESFARSVPISYQSCCFWLQWASLVIRLRFLARRSTRCSLLEVGSPARRLPAFGAAF